MSVDPDIAGLLQGAPRVGDHEQAFPFVTVDPAGFPHAALLSRAELEVAATRECLFIVLAGPATRANVCRTGTALIIAVDGTVAHYAKLRAAHLCEEDGVLAGRFDIVEHKRDDLGVELRPIQFTSSADIAERERWGASRIVLHRLMDEATGRA